MIAKKGIFKVNTNKGWKELEGSYCHCFPFSIHKEKGRSYWTITHMATGMAAIQHVSKWKQAKEAVTALRKYPIFLMPDLESWNRALNRMKAQEPDAYDIMMDLIRRTQ